MNACPSETALLEFVERGDHADASDPARGAIRAHLIDCATCRAAVAVLAAQSPRQLHDTTLPLGATGGEAAPLPPDTMVGRYRVVALLGKGGMGAVYSAHDPALDRIVAVKLLRADRSRDDAALSARLQREAQALARLSHANVVRVHDVGTCAQGVFIAMELVEGETLREWLRAPRPWRAIVDTFVQAGRGLSAAHQAGLVHRDFKPENVLIGRDGRVLVTDFGLARVVGHDAEPERAGRADETASSPLEQSITRTGALVGTPAYMAPEQIAGGVVDVRTDVFSFSVALWEALSGVRPFAGNDSLEILANIESGKRQPGRIGVAPARIRRVLERGLQASPAARPATMEELLAPLAPDAVPTRWLLGGALAALVVTVGAVTFVRAREAAHQCDAVASGFDAIWNPARRAAVEHAFAATGLSYAADAGRHVVAALDGYRDRWRAMSIEACQAGRVRHEQSAELFDLRMECLAQRRASAGALTELFTHADPATVERSVAAAQSLEPLDACASVATLRAADPLPRAPEKRAQIAALRGKLADVEARERVGRYAEALKAAGPLADEAVAIGWNPLTAQALLLRGRLETTAYQFQPARKTLADAAAAAMAGHEDRALAQIYIALVRASFDSFDKQLQEQAQQWLALASAWIDRLGNADSLRLQLLDAQGRELMHENRIDEAGQVFQRAMELERKLGDQAGLGSTLDDLGVMLGKKGRRKEARALLEQSATVLAQALGPRHPKTAVPSYVLAALLKDEGPLDVAEAAARRVLEIYEGVLPEGHGRTLAAHNLLGEILLQEGRFDEALAQFRGALARRRPGDQGAALDRIGAAIALDRLGKRDEALSTLETALQTTTEPLHRGMVILERSDVRLRGGQAALALADANAALALFEAPGKREPELLIGALTSVGKAQLALHAPAQALPPLERAATLEPEATPLETGHVDAALARALVASHGDAARARRLAEGAAARLEPIGAEGAREANELRSWLRDAVPRP